MLPCLRRAGLARTLHRGASESPASNGGISNRFAQARFELLLDLDPTLELRRLDNHVRFQRPIVLVQFPQMQMMHFGHAGDDLHRGQSSSVFTSSGAPSMRM